MIKIILTVGWGAQLTIRLGVGEAVSVSQRFHGFHGETRQVVIVPVVKISLVGIYFSCRHNAQWVIQRHFYGIRYGARYDSTHLGQFEWCSAKGSLSCPESCPGVGRSHAVLDPSGCVNLGGNELISDIFSHWTIMLSVLRSCDEHVKERGNYRISTCALADSGTGVVRAAAQRPRSSARGSSDRGQSRPWCSRPGSGCWRRTWSTPPGHWSNPKRSLWSNIGDWFGRTNALQKPRGRNESALCRGRCFSPLMQNFALPQFSAIYCKLHKRFGKNSLWFSVLLFFCLFVFVF